MEKKPLTMKEEQVIIAYCRVKHNRLDRSIALLCVLKIQIGSVSKYVVCRRSSGTGRS